MMEWLRRLVAACRANKILSGIGYKVRQTSSGVILEVLPGAGGGTSTPVNIKLFQFQEMKKDYLLCSESGVFTPGDGDNLVRVAKPPLLRFSIVTRSIHGAFFTYTGYNLSTQRRVANLGAIVGVQQEEQEIIDAYEVPDTITAIQIDTGVSVPADDSDLDRDPETSVGWLDLNVDGRFWASL